MGEINEKKTDSYSGTWKNYYTNVESEAILV
jgi:hypothetical protein